MVDNNKKFKLLDWMMLIVSIILIIFGSLLIAVKSIDGWALIFWGLILGYHKIKKYINAKLSNKIKSKINETELDHLDKKHYSANFKRIFFNRKILKSSIIIIILLIISIYLYKTQIYIPKIKQECNKLAIQQAVDLALGYSYKDFIKKNYSPEDAPTENEYYKVTLEKHAYRINDYDQFYKVCTRYRGL
jgi:hypothetical protein